MILDSHSKLKGLLANTAMFQVLDEPQLDRVMLGTRALRVDQHQRVVERGAPADGFYLLIYGQVRIGLHGRQGGHATLEILGDGQCFGLAEMLLGHAHLSFVDTLKDSLLLQVERQAVLAAAQENFALASGLMGCMGRQFYGLMRDIVGLSQSARQRLATYLLRLAEAEGGGAALTTIELSASKTMIASRLNLTPETFSRVLRELAGDGLIAVSGRRITVLDREKLGAPGL
jgi:CRP-like cAMP-binding protein